MEKLGNLDLDDSDGLDDMELPKATGGLAEILKQNKPDDDDDELDMPDPTAKVDTSIYKVVEPTPRFGVRYNANAETI